MSEVRLVAVGPRAVLVEVDDAFTAASLAGWARRSALAADDIVPAARTVLFDGARLQDVRDMVGDWVGHEEEVLPDSVVTVPATYDGPDLVRVADLWGCSVADVVERHTSVEFLAIFSGFAPGFSYLAGLPEEWAVPRLDSPRARVRPGSVALADTWCAIYPGSSPGGWLLLGTTDLVLWNPRRDQPALLAPGTRVRFRQARS